MLRSTLWAHTEISAYVPLGPEYPSRERAGYCSETVEMAGPQRILSFPVEGRCWWLQVAPEIVDGPQTTALQPRGVYNHSGWSYRAFTRRQCLRTTIWQTAGTKDGYRSGMRKRNWAGGDL
jgi:hypothetical protein